jgi:hypothetical protein
MCQDLPLDGEASHTRLLSKDIAADVLDLRLRRGIGSQFFRVVLVVHVVAHTDEFTTVIAASEQNDGDAEDLGIGDPLVIGGIGLENELVHSDGDGTDEQRVEFLILLGAGDVSER